MYGFLYTKIISQDLPLFDNSILDFDSTIMVSMTEGVRGIFMGARTEAPCKKAPRTEAPWIKTPKTKPPKRQKPQRQKPQETKAQGQQPQRQNFLF